MDSWINAENKGIKQEGNNEERKCEMSPVLQRSGCKDFIDLESCFEVGNRENDKPEDNDNLQDEILKFAEVDSLCN